MPDLSPPPQPPRESRGEYDLLTGWGPQAQAAGLVGARWYQSPVPRAQLKALMQRQDGPALRDTALWLALVGAAGVAMAATWGGPWFALAFLVYATLFTGAADSRWHESSHGTAFKTRWMNDALYQLASFMALRRPTRWRWSHARHHSDTLVTGRDPEVNAVLPLPLGTLLLNVFALRYAPGEYARVLANALGRISPQEKSYVPESEWPRMVREARAWVAVYAAVVALAVGQGSALPLFFVGLPAFVGAWVHTFFGLTQHAGLPENVLDHRLNCRTVVMNPVFRFLYWNMNYHVEHHMVPMVPYHALPALHAAIRADCPPPYPSLAAAYAEILPALWRQRQDPHWAVRRPLPDAAGVAAAAPPAPPGATVLPHPATPSPLTPGAQP
ncbi:fatty acid desaturase [Ideonella livida]|uniref:Fatty acid desaturase n=1 Tax=Ideonella livida TaxID=2707176 RepID=A0A7C9PIG7_9BURK|nr:fatty acid desaturase [Ideonella livida]NDY92051.1 fatty acid desaturase [Ideonella livida]